jgi:hypothetical protein
MRQPTGYVARSHIKYDHAALAERAANRTPLIKGQTDNERNRGLDKDIVWAEKPTTTLGRKERANVQSEVAGFTVLNNVGSEAEGKFGFYRKHRVVGLLTKAIQPHPGAKDPNMRAAVDLKGLTWMRNNNPDRTIHAGQKIIAEIPENTQDAERREGALGGSPEGPGVPSGRYTAFPDVWSADKATDGLAEDLNKTLRRILAPDRANYPSTRDQIANMRRLALLGAALCFYGFLDQAAQPTTTSEFINTLRGAVTGDNAQFQGLVDNIMNGTYDGPIAALLMPRDSERMIQQNRVPPNTQRGVLGFHQLQMNGFKGMFNTVEQSLNEAGRERILGTAVTNAAPGDTFNILLDG